MNIKQKIRDWLEIKESENFRDTYSYDQFIKDISELKQRTKENDAEITRINEKLRPEIRTRLEQCKSALDIQQKFLNEIWYEIKK